MAKKKEELVHCRYPKCCKLHESTELKKDDAVQGGSRSYYHPDCYHIMQTINQIKDIFYVQVNPMMTGAQIGQLVSIANNMVFEKKIDVDLIKFAIEYFIRYKPGKLKYPGGISYIVQNRDVLSAWEREKERKIRTELKIEMEKKIEKLEGDNSAKDLGEVDSWEIPDSSFVYKPQKAKSFADILH